MPTWAIVLLCSVGGFFVLAVLAAIAIPTFLGVSTSASDRSAQSNLNTALTDARATYAATGAFPADLAAQLGQTEPSLQFVPDPASSASPETISVASTSQAVLMTDRSPSGTCWWVLAVGSTPSGVGPGLPSVHGVYYDSSQGLACQASVYPTTGWQSNGFPSA